LQTQLKERGVLDDAWQPPSLNVQMPEQTPELAESAMDAEPTPLENPYTSLALDTDAPPATTTPPLTDAEAESRLLASAAEYVALYEDPVADASAPGTPDASQAAEVPTASELATTADPAIPAETDAPPAAKTRKRRVRAKVEQTEDRETVATEEAS
jgi:hypothetical protein